MWKTAPPPIQPLGPVSEARSGPVGMSIRTVQRADGDLQRFQYLSISLGRHTTAPHAECLKTWPREALTIARQALDDFEEFLEAQP
jgi:hypothetical protein